MNASSRHADAGDRWRAGVLALSLAAAVVVAACGSSRTTIRTAPVASLSGAIDCSLETGKEMGFEAVSIDRPDHRVVLERRDPSVSRSNPSFRRAVGQLTVLPAEPGASSEIAVEARFFHEYFDRRGRTRRQREPSDRILAAADSLLSTCASGGSSAGRGAEAATGVSLAARGDPGGG